MGLSDEYVVDEAVKLRDKLRCACISWCICCMSIWIFMCKCISMFILCVKSSVLVVLYTLSIYRSLAYTGQDKYVGY